MSIAARRLQRIEPMVKLKHPGVMYNQAQLNQMAAEVSNSSHWRKAKYDVMTTRKSGYGANQGREFASLSWVPKPVPVVKRFAGSQYADVGSDDLIADGGAALAHALKWRLKGDRASASKASQILNAWSSTLTSISYYVNGSSTQPTYAEGGRLIAGWTASIYARAGEIMAHSGWNPTGSEVAFNASRLREKFRTIWMPILYPIEPIGQHNWSTAVIDGAMQAAVFTNDAKRFNMACDWWRDIVPTVFWMPGDRNSQPHLAAATSPWFPSSGAPRTPMYSRYNKSENSQSTPTAVYNVWHKPKSWPAGLSGEMGRDFHHNAMIFATVANAAETAWHQGIDLYRQEQTRIVTATELFAGILHDVWKKDKVPPTGWPFDKNAKSGSHQTSAQTATFELIYMHYLGRRGVSMPKTRLLLDEYCRPSTYDIDTGPGMIFCEELTYRTNWGYS